MRVSDAMMKRVQAANERKVARQGEVLAPRSTDDEASALLDELDRLQHWCVLLGCRQIDGAMSAADLVQRTRILIIERCKRKPGEAL